MNHKIVIQIVWKRLADRKFLDLIKDYGNAGVMGDLHVNQLLENTTRHRFPIAF